MTNVLNATGLAADISGWSMDKAEAMARSIGGEVADYTTAWKILGRSFAATGLVVDGVQFWVGITDEVWKSDDAINGFQFGANYSLKEQSF